MGHKKADEGNRGCMNVTDKGVKKFDNFVDIIYGRPLSENAVRKTMMEYPLEKIIFSFPLSTTTAA